jgi:hypothetical protein
MRVKLSRPTTYTPEFNDNKTLPPHEQITADLTPLKMGDFLDLAEHFQKIGQGRQQVDTNNLSVGSMKDLILNAGRLLPAYVVVKGLVNEDTNEPLTINEVATQPPFIPLAVELLGKLSEISAPTEGDVKN